MNQTAVGIEGYYTVYYTGIAGSGMGMLALDTGQVSGSDFLGGSIIGRYAFNALKDCLDFDLIFKVPANTPLVMDVPPSDEPYEFPLQTTLPKDFARGASITVETPFGPVVMRFMKVNEFAA